jgi:alcohol dehydrogenase
MDGINNFKIIANNFKFNSPLLVTDPVLIKTGVVQAVIKQLDYLKIKYTIFDGVQPNPSIQVVQKIIDMYQTSKSDALISIGGGSAHDAIKGASLVLSNKGRELKKFQGLNVTPNVSIAPIIAINTTAGTGSDVTNAAVITDEVKHFKMTLVDKNIQPHAIVDDSNLMLGLPAKQSA